MTTLPVVDLSHFFIACPTTPGGFPFNAAHHQGQLVGLFNVVRHMAFQRIGAARNRESSNKGRWFI